MSSLLGLFNVKTKSELETYCRDLVIDQTDLVELILAARIGALSPYLYASHFDEIVGDHLRPREDELEALGKNGIGPLEGKAAKAINRVGQLFKERRVVAAHLFYTSDHGYWNLLYMLQGEGGDTDPRNNHWRHGPHMHFISDLWGRLQLREVWQRVMAGDLKLPSMHIRFTAPHTKTECPKWGRPIADRDAPR